MTSFQCYGEEIVVRKHYMIMSFLKQCNMQIPKMKAFISDPEDMRGDSWQQSTWDDMIVHV